MEPRPRILFLCTGNSCRSQMAEGLCRRLRGEQIESSSAGIKKDGLNPRAVRVMSELGIDISSYVSKTVSELSNLKFDYVITLCGHAHETCPVFPEKTRVVHQGFEDPPALAESASSEPEILACYRQVRDQIREYILTLPASLKKA